MVVAGILRWLCLLLFELLDFVRAKFFSFFWCEVIRLNSSHLACCKLLADWKFVRGGCDIIRWIMSRGVRRKSLLGCDIIGRLFVVRCM